MLLSAQWVQAGPGFDTQIHPVFSPLENYVFLLGCS